MLGMAWIGWGRGRCEVVAGGIVGLAVRGRDVDG